jgi:hypothetical protein
MLPLNECQTPKEVIKRYEMLREQIKALELAQDETKAVLIGLAGQSGEIVADEYRVTIKSVPGEAFKLGEALKAIRRDVLQPFITSFEAVRVYIRKAA